MPTATTPFGKELIRPAKRPQQKKAAKRRKKVMGPLKAFVGPRNLEQALDHAVPPPTVAKSRPLALLKPPRITQGL